MTAITGFMVRRQQHYRRCSSSDFAKRHLDRTEGTFRPMDTPLQLRRQPDATKPQLIHRLTRVILTTTVTAAMLRVIRRWVRLGLYQADDPTITQLTDKKTTTISSAAYLPTDTMYSNSCLPRRQTINTTQKSLSQRHTCLLKLMQGISLSDGYLKTPRPISLIFFP